MVEYRIQLAAVYRPSLGALYTTQKGQHVAAPHNFENVLQNKYVAYERALAVVVLPVYLAEQIQCLPALFIR